MGRKTISDEERLAKLAPSTRIDLTVALALHRAAQQAEVTARAGLKAAIERGLAEGASYRDLEAALGIPRASINALVLG